MVESLASEPEVPGSSPETTDFVTKRSENLTLVSLFTEQYKLVYSWLEAETLFAMLYEVSLKRAYRGCR